MAKKVTGYIKLQIPAGQANPSPPVGPALGQQGVNIMEFCKAFNAQTQALEKGLPTPVVITEHGQGWQSFTPAARGHRQAEDAGSDGERSGRGGAHHRRQRPQHGCRRGGALRCVS